MNFATYPQFKEGKSFWPWRLRVGELSHIVWSDLRSSAINVKHHEAGNVQSYNVRQDTEEIHRSGGF